MDGIQSLPAIERRRALARQLRADCVRAADAAGSGHPTSGLSAADLMAVLLDGYLHYDFGNHGRWGNDYIVFSKGHATPLLYAMLKAVGVVSADELATYRTLGSRLEGHPAPVVPGVDVATGSLGQGVAISVGLALASRALGSPARTWVLTGDSEMAEGSMWEGFDLGGFYNPGNVTAIIDVNRLGQRGPTQYEWNTDVYAERLAAFGWEPIVIDGHDLESIDQGFAAAVADGRPTALIARTIKGKGAPFAENRNGFHGKAFDEEQEREALANIDAGEPFTITPAKPPNWEGPSFSTRSPARLEGYSEPTATRDGFGDGLVALGRARDDVVVLDGEVSNSTRSGKFQDEFPQRFYQMYIAEQRMVAAAVGMGAAGYVPFVTTFAAFLTRAHDFLRMATVSRSRMCVSGSHAGVSIGQDGPSQMGLEDLAMMRSLHGSAVLYPCDAYQAAALTMAMPAWDGISYIRTTRGKSPVLYEPGHSFAIGGSEVLRGGEPGIDAAVVAAGATVFEALDAAEELAGDGLTVRVIDAYSVKPLDVATIARAAHDAGGRLVVVEDHHPEGGLGEACLSALAASEDVPALRFRHLAVRTMPGSATEQEQRDAAGISAPHIVEAVRGIA